MVAVTSQAVGELGFKVQCAPITLLLLHSSGGSVN